MIDARQFQLAFYEWVLAVNEIVQGQIINIDGKCLCGSDDKALGKRANQRVSAWAEANELVLGQRKVDEKSNEITAIPEMLKLLTVSGCIVTMDAMGRQTNIAKTIVEANAGYILSVKENQGRLYEGISVLFAVDQAQDFKYASFEQSSCKSIFSHGFHRLSLIYSKKFVQIREIRGKEFDWIFTLLTYARGLIQKDGEQKTGQN